MGAGMPLEFVTPCEPLSTEEPVADKGPFASVQAHVGPQQGRLPESLATVGDMAHMLLLALLSRPENGRWGRGKGKRSEGGGRRQGQNRMERGSGVRSKNTGEVGQPGVPFLVCIPGRGLRNRVPARLAVWLLS